MEWWVLLATGGIDGGARPAGCRAHGPHRRMLRAWVALLRILRPHAEPGPPPLSQHQPLLPFGADTAVSGGRDPGGVLGRASDAAAITARTRVDAAPYFGAQLRRRGSAGARPRQHVAV